MGSNCKGHMIKVLCDSITNVNLKLRPVRKHPLFNKDVIGLFESKAIANVNGHQL